MPCVVPCAPKFGLCGFDKTLTETNSGAYFDFRGTVSFHGSQGRKSRQKQQAGTEAETTEDAADNVL